MRLRLRDLVRVLLLLLLLLLCNGLSVQQQNSKRNWDEVRHVLESQVGDAHAFPGVVAIVADEGGIVKSFEIGSHTYEENSTRMSLNKTIFDLASLTKVTTTTTAAMQLYEKGMISLNRRVAEYFPNTFVSMDSRKEKMTVHHLLVHSGTCWSLSQFSKHKDKIPCTKQRATHPIRHPASAVQVWIVPRVVSNPHRVV